MRRREKWVVLAVGLACGALAAVSLIARRALLGRFRLWQLRADPERLTEMAGCDEGTPERDAAALFVSEAEGARCLLRAFLRDLELDSRLWITNGLSYEGTQPNWGYGSFADAKMALLGVWSFTRFDDTPHTSYAASMRWDRASAGGRTVERPASLSLLALFGGAAGRDVELPEYPRLSFRMMPLGEAVDAYRGGGGFWEVRELPCYVGPWACLARKKP